MQRITGLPDEQVLIYEAQAEAALRAALAAVMDKIARRIEASAPVLASALVLVAADGVEDQGDEVLPSSVPAGDGLPPGQPYVSPDDLASIPPMWQEAVASQVLPIVGQVFLDAAGRTYANMVEASSIAGLPSVGSLAAEQYLARAKNTFEQIGDTLWAQARSELTAGFEAGESIPQLAERLRESANVTARTGVLVARTQVNEASNAGSFETARASGLQMQKEFIATPDLRTRPTHLAADGQRVPLNEPFIVGGFSAMFPAAPTLPPAERLNCRCTIGYIMPDRAPAQVRADDLATQQLEELPGTTSVDDLAAAQSARLQQIIDEQHAAAEQVIEDVHQQFRDRFGKAAGPGPIGTYAPAFGDQTIGYIRPSLLASRSTAEFEAAWRAEMRAITGRDITLDALPADISVSTAREYAEATLQMFEQFPEAKLRRISWHDDSAGKHASSYAHVERGSETISFNMHWARDSRRRAYLAALRKDVADWNTSLGTSWSVRGASVPQATVYHEFFHIIDLENLGDSLQSRVTSLLQARATAQGIRTIDELIASDISTYAGSRRELNELIAEAGTDVMVNGAAASQISREIFDLVRAEYRRRGFEIRTAPALPEDLGDVFPKAAAPLSRAEFDARASGAARDADALSAAPSGREPRRGPLTAQQSSAIARYIDQGAHDRVNTALREGRTDRLVDTLDAAFAESRLTRDVVVYRGAPGRTVFGDRLDDNLSGFEWDDPAYLSTSAHIERASGFGNVGDEQVLMRVLAPEGTPAVQASRFMRPNGRPDEGELLIGRGQRLRVVSDRIEPVTLYGEAVPTRVLDVEIVPRGVSAAIAPPVAAPRALSTQTVAQLRALAKERGIAIPAGARKADLVRALSEETPGAPKGMPSLEVRTSLSAAEQKRVRTLVQRDPQIFATVQDRYGPVPTSGNLSDIDAAWLETIYKRDRVFVERVAQEAQIKRMIATEAKKLGITPTQYRAREAEKLKTLVEDKPIIVRRGERGLQDILASGRFKTSLETGRRQPGLTVAKDRRELGESVMGVADDVALAERPVYGYVGIRGVEPALAPGKKIAGIAQREGQEDLLSTYGQIEIVLKPEVRARTTVTVGDSLDEIGLLRPSPIDAPSADSVGFARRLDDAISEPDWTRRSYIEAQIHGGLRREDILEVVFPDDPTAAIVSALRESGISWRVLREGDAPIFPTAPAVAPLDEKALLRVAARERNRLIESSQGTAKLLAEVDELIANKATKAAIRQRLDPALIAPEQVFAGADPAVVEALRKALDTGDPAKLRAALTRAGTKGKLKPISKAGAKTKYDPETMEGVGGIDIPAGAQVTVVRRGTTLTLPDGSTMQLTRAQVTPIAPKPAPVKAVRAPAKRAPRAPKIPAGQLEARVKSGVVKAEPLSGGQNAATELVTFADGGQAVRKAAKVVEGRSAKLQQDAEELGALMLRRFGIRAPQTYRQSARVIYQDVVEGRVAAELPRVPGRFDVAGPYYDSDEGRVLGLVDALMDNYDRNAGNWLVGADGSLGGIDHGFAFQWHGHGQYGKPSVAPFGDGNLFSDPLSRPFPHRGEWADNDYSPADIATARRLLLEMAPDFERLDHTDWLDNAFERLGYIEQHATGTKVRITAPTRVVRDQTIIERDAELRRVTKAPTRGEPRILGSGSQGSTKLVTTADGEYVEKTFGSWVKGAELKAVRDGEELGPLVLDAFGLRGPASYRVGERGMISEFMEGKTGAELFPSLGYGLGNTAEFDAIAESVEGRLMGLADYLMGNSDRNSGNWLHQAGGRLAGIDHGYAFQMERFRDVTITPSGDFGVWLQAPDRFHLTETVDVDPRDLAIVRARLEALRPRFTEASRSAWFNTMMRRLKELERRAVGTTPRITP